MKKDTVKRQRKLNKTIRILTLCKRVLAKNPRMGFIPAWKPKNSTPFQYLDMLKRMAGKAKA